jgi:DNA-binding CsgD family transcriptional regulator
MYAKDPDVVSRQQTMRNLLVTQGLSIAEVAIQVGLSKKRVYSYAKSRGLPYNRPVKPGGRKEAQILRMIALGYTLEIVATSFDMSPAAVQNVLRSASAAQIRDRSGHQGEATLASPEENGDVR